MWVLRIKLISLHSQDSTLLTERTHQPKNWGFKIFVLDDSIINVKSITAITIVIATTIIIQSYKRMSLFLRRYVQKHFGLKLHGVSNFFYFQTRQLESILGPK